MSALPLYTVLDFEYTSKGIGSFKASPHDVNNFPTVLVIHSIDEDGKIFKSDSIVNFPNNPRYREEMWRVVENHLELTKCLVAHNIKFELAAIHRLVSEFSPTTSMESWLRQITIIDTMVADYLIYGQDRSFPLGLEECYDRNTTTANPLFKKDSYITSKFADPDGMDQIFAEGRGRRLVDYCAGDVSATSVLVRILLEKLDALGMYPLFNSQMTALKAYASMEARGMWVDKTMLEAIEADLQKYFALCERATEIMARTLFPDTLVFNWSQRSHISRMFYGGRYTIDKLEKVGVFKNGKDKMKRVYTEHVHDTLWTKTCRALMNPTPGADGLYSMTDEDLEAISKLPSLEIGPLAKLAKLVRELRRIRKLLSTYIKNIWANVLQDSMVHPSIHTTVTATGRLSCSNPNLQNQAPEVSKVFRSRWDGGRIVEVDWSQLEVVGLAVRCRDKTLIDDIITGKDIHTELFRSMNGRTPTVAERKAFKPRTFALIYGAAAKTIAQQSGCKLSEARAFMKTFYTRYPGVKEFHDSMKDEVTRLRVPGMRLAGSATTPPGVAKWQCPISGRRYTFVEYPEGGFPSPAVKNYPVQGLSTGDWHQFVTGELAMALWGSDIADKALLVMTVHDSLVFDCRDEDTVIRLNELLTRTLPVMYKKWEEHFGTDWILQPGFEVKVGEDWANCKPIGDMK